MAVVQVDKPLEEPVSNPSIPDGTFVIKSQALDFYLFRMPGLYGGPTRINIASTTAENTRLHSDMQVNECCPVFNVFKE